MYSQLSKIVLFILSFNSVYAPMARATEANKSISASIKKSSAHREHEAHVHGGGTLNIAFDGLSGKIEFKAAAESILGFETMAKSKSQLETLKNAKSSFENSFLKWVIFPSDAKCKITNQLVKQEFQQKKNSSGVHSDWLATYDVHCEMPLLGKELKINFEQFKNIKDLDVSVLVDNVQKSEEYKGAAISIEL